MPEKCVSFLKTSFEAICGNRAKIKPNQSYNLAVQLLYSGCNAAQ